MFLFISLSIFHITWYRSDSYKGSSNFNAVLTPLTFLVSYFNSAINPLLYAFLSKNFRKGMRELLCCSYKKSKMGEPYQPRTTTVQVKRIIKTIVNKRFNFNFFLICFTTIKLECDFTVFYFYNFADSC